MKRHQNLGLTAIQKFLLQLAAAILFLMLMRFEGHITPHLYVPFLRLDLPLSWPAYMVFCAFVIVGCVNAVNITDGLDGLCTGTSAIIGCALAIMAYLGGHIVYSSYLNIMYIPGSSELVVYMAAFIGALVGWAIPEASLSAA